MRLNNGLCAAIGAAGLSVALITTSLAAGVFQGYPTAVPPLTGNEQIPADTGLTAGQNPATELITTAQLGSYLSGVATGSFRNVIVGGDFGTNPWSRGTAPAAVTGQTGTYTADQWSAWAATAGSITVSKQTGAADIPSAAITGGGANTLASMRLLHTTSDTNANQHCVAQLKEPVESARFIGNTAVLSFYAKAGSTFVADMSGSALQVSIGTSTDNAATITMARFIAGTNVTVQNSAGYNGVTGTANTQTTTPITTTWTKYQVAAAIPATAVDIGVKICFTPLAGTAVATDWAEIANVQLEASTATVANAVATPFEYRPATVELVLAQRYLYIINELAAGVVQSTVGTAQGTTTTCTTYLPFPVIMRAAPTYTNALSAATFKIVSASQAATVLGTPFSATLNANGVNGASINFTTTGMTAKDSCFLVGAGGTGQMLFTAEL